MNKPMLILSLLLTATGAVFAQDASTATPRVDRREAHQQQRIDQGVASGQLTPPTRPRGCRPSSAASRRPRFGSRATAS